MLDSAVRSRLANTNFPRRLVCPSCGAALAPRACSCPAATQLAYSNGIARVISKEPALDPTADARLARIVELAGTLPWRHAVEQELGSTPFVRQLITGFGPEIIHAFPWSRIKDVLDIGAGMGGISGPMAHYARSVAAVEPDPQHAEFLRIRAEQDGLDLFPIIADCLMPPFADGSFDLVTVDGVFERLGQGVEGDPMQIHRDFLARALRLLRPDGYLYIGAKTRLGLGKLLGRPDGSGLAFTSLMPRSVADRYCRWRFKQAGGGKQYHPGYRTYSYTPSTYQRMVADAGFGAVMVQGVSNTQMFRKAYYDVDNHDLRKTVLGLVEPPLSLAGRIKRAVQNVEAFGKPLENEVAIFAAKGGAPEQLLWNGFSGNHTAGQINTYGKVLAVCVSGEGIQSVAEAGKFKLVRERMAEGFAVLKRAEAACGRETTAWPLRWSRPLRSHIYNGRQFHHYELVDGRELSGIVLSGAQHREAALGLIDTMLAGYPEFCRRLSVANGYEAAANPLSGLVRDLRAVWAGGRLMAALERAVEHAHARGWQTSIIHGDLSGNNVMVRPDRSMVIKPQSSAACRSRLSNTP